MPTPWPEHDGNAKNFALPGSRVKPSPPGGVENIHVFFAEKRGLDMATIPLDDIFSDGHMLPDQIHPAKGGQTTIQEALEPAIRKAATS